MGALEPGKFVHLLKQALDFPKPRLEIPKETPAYGVEAGLGSTEQHEEGDGRCCRWFVFHGGLVTGLCYFADGKLNAR